MSKRAMKLLFDTVFSYLSETFYEQLILKERSDENFLSTPEAFERAVLAWRTQLPRHHPPPLQQRRLEPEERRPRPRPRRRPNSSSRPSTCRRRRRLGPRSAPRVCALRTLAGR